MITSAVLAMCVHGATIHEGFSQKVYVDVDKSLAIGHGYNLTHNPLNLPKSEIKSLKKHGISKAEALKLTERLCEQTENRLNELSWFDSQPDYVKYVIIDMAYNMGVNGAIGFDKSIKLIKNNKMLLASKEILNSKWARQTHGRARELAEVLKTGKV
jgi:lysozyme